MKSIAKKGGLQGNYTNHSGKKTCATQLYVGGVPEAEIMSVTGHRSQQGVRKYMRSNVDMKKNICKIFGSAYINIGGIAGTVYNPGVAGTVFIIAGVQKTVLISGKFG